MNISRYGLLILMVSLVSTSLYAQLESLLGIQNAYIKYDAFFDRPLDACQYNLLKNPSLEQGMESWYGGGELTIVSNGANQALQSCYTFEAAFQTIKAEPNEIYTLRVFVKKDKNATGTVSFKFLDEEFVPIHQEFLDIESENYALLQHTAIGSAKTAFIEVNVFQDGGEGCVFADDWCLSKGKQGAKSCSTTQKHLENRLGEQAKKKYKQTTKENLPIGNHRLMQTLNALSQHPVVIDFWAQQTEKKRTKQSAVFRAVRNYIFSEIQ